ncbi:MAG: hypothetical protein AMXMBFR84_21630 [Candidatus Hydrogenedentota bacterium]
MNRSVDISVVVCTYNRAEMLRPSVESLLAIDTEGLYAHEIVVVDDGSTDDTQATLQDLKARSPVPMCVVRGAGTGVAAARNTGICASSGRYIAFFDDDQFAHTAWLTALWRTMKTTSAACVGGARTLDLETGVLESMPRISRLYLGEIPVEPFPRECGRNDLLCTGTVLIDRTLFDHVGVFDESLTQGGEDTEFFTRVRKAGGACWFTPLSLVRHMVPEYRMKRQYLIWSAIRGGDCFAIRDAREWGVMYTIGVAMARLMHAIALHMPAMALAAIRSERAFVLARWCQICRALAYARRSALLALPRSNAAGKGAFAIDFRSERNLFPKSPQ